MFFLGNTSACKLFICERKLNVLNTKYKNPLQITNIKMLITVALCANVRKYILRHSIN